MALIKTTTLQWAREYASEKPVVMAINPRVIKAPGEPYMSIIGLANALPAPMLAGRMASPWSEPKVRHLNQKCPGS